MKFAKNAKKVKTIVTFEGKLFVVAVGSICVELGTTQLFENKYSAGNSGQLINCLLMSEKLKLPTTTTWLENCLKTSTSM